MGGELPPGGTGRQARGCAHELRLFCVALQFLTRVPVPRRVGWHPDWLQSSVRHFPAVGLVVGAWAALLLWAAAQVLPVAVAVGLSMAGSVWLTGAFHEDGLADTCDALGGGHIGRERALEIMKDSRIGSYGAVALLLVLGIRAATLHALVLRDLGVTLALLPLAHAWSRAVPVLLLRWLRYAGDHAHAKAKPLAQHSSTGNVAMALGWCAAAGIAAAMLDGIGATQLLAAAAAALATTLWFGRWLQRRLGGFTGDTLGAAQQGGELVVLLVLLAAAGRP